MGCVRTGGSGSSGGLRAGVWLAALLGGLLTPAVTQAQTFTWNQPTSGADWLTASNWLQAGGPPNAVSNVAVFGNAIGAANTVNLSTNVMVGELRFADVTAGSLGAMYTVGSSSQTITLNNNGSPGLVTVTGFTAANQTVAANLSAAGGQPLTVTNNGAPGVTTLTLSGGLSATTAGTALNFGGSSDTTVSGAIASSFGTLTKSGSGTLTLSSTSNAYTGGTVINGGTVKVTADTNLGAAAGTVTLNGGALQFGAVFTSSRNFTLGTNGGTILSALGDGLTSNPQINGVISGVAGTGPLTFDGGGYVALLGSNTYTGPTVINNAGVILISDLLGPARGRLANTASITINGFVGGQVGILDFQNLLGGDNNRVNAAAPITLNGGLLSFGAGLSGAVTETLGGLTVRGFGTLYANQFGTSGGTGTASAAFATISRSDNFSTLYVGGPVSGTSVAGTSVQFLFTGGGPPLSGGGTGNQIGIIPWIGGDVGSSGSPTGHASTFYTYNGNGLSALDPAGTNFQQIASGGQLNGAVITLAKNNAITGDPLALPASTTVTILSLVQNPTSTASSTINGPSTSTLTVSTGAIANINQLTFNGPTLNFGANTGYLWLGNEFVVQGTSRITGTNGLVVSSNSEDGRNELFLINTTNPNAFTGGLYLNGTARVAFDTADSQLGAAGEVISFRGGTLWYIGTGSVSLATAGTNRPLQLTAAGGGMIRVESGTLTVPGVISGTEQLTVTGPGTLVLSNTGNTYAGGTTLGDSTLAIAGPGSLGTGNITLGVQIGATTFSGGTLRFDFSGTVTANINHAFSSTLNTNGNNVTLSGIVSGNGATLTKAGAGTLTLSGANTYSGNTTVSAGTLLVTNTAGSGTGYGAVTVNSGAALGGTGTVAGPVTVNNAGGKLIAGLPAAPGTLTLRGAATLTSGSIFQTTLAGTTAGTGYGQLVVAPGGSIALGSSTLNALITYTPSGTDKLFIINNQNATGGLSGTFNGLAQGATYTFGNGTTALISYTGDFGSASISGGNDVVLYSFVPVPEPASVLGLAALALGGLAWRARRKPATAAV
jgi:fibronectin-binding autotransporter adhesin